MKKWSKIYILLCFSAVMTLTLKDVHALVANEVAVIVNSEHSDSNQLAHYYCSKRNIPLQHIIELSMPLAEEVTHELYASVILPEILRQFKAAPWASQIKCLVTTMGVPLIIGNKVLTTKESGLKNKLFLHLNHSFTALGQMHEEMHQLLKKLGKDVYKENTNNLSPFKIKKDLSNGIQFLNDSVKLFSAGLEAVKGVDIYLPENESLIQDFNQSYEKWGGKAIVFNEGKKRYLAMKESVIKEALGNELNVKMIHLNAINGELALLTASFSDLLNMSHQRIVLIIERGGMLEYCNALLSAMQCFDVENSLSAFDSELSLMLFDQYPTANWIHNVFRNHHSGWSNEIAQDDGSLIRPLMVARLDGPGIEIAKGLVDLAIAGESHLLKGTAYLDARGIFKEKNKRGSYGYYDQSLRDLAPLLRSQTNLKVVLDDKMALFIKGRCLDTTLYCGWYSVREYVDSFKFNPGAVGYHLASHECETLRVSILDSNIWCKRMLEHGITATIGPVAEPYLQAFPNPKGFFTELTSGKYCLVECYYHTKPFNSWRMVLVGDPLFKPRYE